ncbi:MAG: pyridoxal phosphate-dependent aminotransferase [Armatimonadetes bacterium]|nr:pyridoxal phosphate-dependent aminotransferase [Armatimonadota bacterium]
MSLAERFISPRIDKEMSGRDGPPGQRAALLKLAAEIKDVVNLNSGDPDLTAAPVAVEAAVEAFRGGKTHYSHGGVPSLRAAIAQKHGRENGFTVDPDTQVIITNGSAEAATIVFQTILEPGDEVLTTDPYYGGHVNNIVAARGRPVFVPTRGDDLWEPDPAEVEKRITPRTRAFIFANPGNPTAAVYRKETLQAFLDIAHRHNILMLPDELFERYVYDGRTHVSMASLPGSEERVVTIHGFSKSYCMTGWRLGWVAAPKWLAPALHKMKYALTMTSSTPNQWGAVAALSDAAKPYYDEVYRTYGERRAFWYDAWTKMGLPQKPAPAAFVGMIDIRRTGRPAYEVSEAILKEARGFIWPGTFFGSLGEGYLRVGLIKPMDVLQDLGRRIGPVVGKMLGAARTA